MHSAPATTAEFATQSAISVTNGNVSEIPKLLGNLSQIDSLFTDGVSKRVEHTYSQQGQVSKRNK